MRAKYIIHFTFLKPKISSKSSTNHNICSEIHYKLCSAGCSVSIFFLLNKMNIKRRTSFCSLFAFEGKRFSLKWGAKKSSFPQASKRLGMGLSPRYINSFLTPHSFAKFYSSASLLVREWYVFSYRYIYNRRLKIGSCNDDRKARSDT